MTLQEYNDLYKMPLLKSMTITTSGGITITNANIVSENMSLEKSLCSENNLRYGRCEAACFTIRIADLNHDFTGEWLNVIQDVVTDSEGYLLTQNRQYLLTEDGFRIKLKDEEIDEATAPYGRFKVYSDKPENDRRWRVLTCYDQMYDILNADVLSWYNTLTFPITIKNLRDSFFSYLGITQVAKTLVNDNFSTPGGFAVSGELSGKTVIESICELNGVFGQMTADGKFDYVSLTDAEELTFDYYVDGTGSYEDYVTDVITGINIKGTANDVGITVGTTDNLYVISSNPLVYGTEGTTALTDALTALLNHISSDSFRPFKVTTYGNPMLPLGTKVTLNTKNKTIVSYVIKKSLTGIQSLKDEVSATGDKHQATNVNSPKSEIFRTQGKVHELEINVDGLTSRVSATETNLQNNYSTTQQMNSAITQSAENITTQVSNTYVTQSAYNAEVQNLQDQIDGRIEYFDGNVVPTLNNPPANSWTTTSSKDSHVGDLYRYHYTQSGIEKTDYYRFDKNTSTSPATYSWVALGESEVDEALRQAELANQKADAAQAQLDSLEQNVEDNYYTKTQTNSAINQSASAITQTVSSTYETKSDSTNKFNTANTNAQGYANDAKNAANAATDNKLKSYYTKTETNSQIQQTATSITQSVSATYTTKEEFGDLQIGGKNILYLSDKNRGEPSVTTYNIGDFPFTEALIENEVYTITAKVTTSSEKTALAFYHSGGLIGLSNWMLVNDEQLYEYIFTANSTMADQTGSEFGHGFCRVYVSNNPSGRQQGAYPIEGTANVEWIKIEKGNKATDWSPAPEDLQSYADGVGASTLSTANANAQGYVNDALEEAKIYTNAQIEVTSESITTTVEKEIKGIQIGSENYLLDSQKMSDWPVGSRTTKNTSEDFTTLSLNGSSADWAASFRTGKTLPLELLDGSPWMLSFEYSCTSNITTMLINVNGTSASPGNIAGRTKLTAFLPENYNELPSTNGEWKRVIFQGKNLTPSMFTSGSGDVYSWCMEIYNRTNEVPLMIRKVKLERGNKATDWSPSSEDVDSNAQTYANNALATARSEITQLSNKIALKVNSQGRIVTAALGVDPASLTSYFSVKADDISFISNGNITLATGSTGRIGIDSTNFKVNKDTGNVSVTGAITATSLTLSGSASVPSSKVSGLATVATTGKASDVSGLASVATTGSYNSLSGKPDLTVYVAKDGTIGTVAEGSTGFVVSSQGLLQASNAIIYGTIFAGAGTIGGWNIESNRILSTYASGNDTYTIRLNRYDDSVGADKNAIEIRTAVGGATTYPFAVKYDGRLIARQATIEGTVTSADLTATGGTVGGWSITTNRLYGGSATKGFAIMELPTGTIGTPTNWVFATGGTSLTNLNNARFRVSGNGNVYMNTCQVTSETGGPTYAAYTNSTYIGVSQVDGYQSGTLMFALNKQGNIYGKGNLTVMGKFYCSGTKSRVVKTNDYGDKALYCYETPSPMFGDVGEGKIAEDGKCYIWLDSTFSETIKAESYQVFLQKYGQGECYVTERTKRYFVVEGTEGMSFGWEIKAKQKGYENLRLDSVYPENKAYGNSSDYATDAINHINQINGEREVA